MTEKIVTKTNLQQGINLWLNKKKHWPSDFHNGLYKHLHEIKNEGLTEQWWIEIVHILWEWKAIRPKTKMFIRDRGLEVLPNLHQTYETVTNELQGEDGADLSLVSWNTLAPLYQIAFDIKGVNSPVFASKTCHFILPNLFPVIDRDVVGVDDNSYEAYWLFCKTQWDSCNIRQELIQTLKEAIISRRSSLLPFRQEDLHAAYPWATKIVELSIIGYKTSLVDRSEH